MKDIPRWLQWALLLSMLNVAVLLAGNLAESPPGEGSTLDGIVLGASAVMTVTMAGLLIRSWLAARKSHNEQLFIDSAWDAGSSEI